MPDTARSGHGTKAGGRPAFLAGPDAPAWKGADRGGSLDALAHLRRGVRLSVADRRVFILFPFALIAGMLIYRVLFREPQIWLIVLGLSVATLYLARGIKNGSVGGTNVLGLALVLGFSLLPLHGLFFGTKMLGAPVYGSYRASVDKVLFSAGDAQRVLVSGISALSGRDPDIRRARLFVRKGPKLAPGMLIEGPIRFAPVPGPAYPGAYDAQFAGYFSGIGAYGTATRPPRIIRQGRPGFGLTLDRLRMAIGERIDGLANGQQAGVLRALVIGDQSGIDAATRRTLGRAGLAHVLAISGLHLSLVAGGVFLTLRFGLAAFFGFAQRFNIKKIAALGGMAAALGYLAISGGSVSAMRATITLMLVFGAVLAGRQALTMRNVAIAAIGILLLSPQSAFSAGFQLSFAAVVALVGAYEFARARPFMDDVRPAGIFSYVKGLAMTSLVAGGATAVFAAYHFQQTAPLGVLGNILAVPMVGFVVLPGAAIGVLLSPLGAELPFFQLAGWGVARVLDVAALVERLSAPLAIHPLLGPGVLVIAFAALCWFAFFNTALRFAGPMVAVPLIVLMGRAEIPDLIVSDRTQAIAVRGEGGFGLLAGRRNSFVVKVWEERLGMPIAQKIAAVDCTGEICVTATQAGGTIGYLGKKPVPPDACPNAALLIGRGPPDSQCPGGQVLDARTLARDGVTTGFWQPAAGKFLLVPAITDNARPWRPVAP